MADAETDQREGRRKKERVNRIENDPNISNICTNFSKQTSLLCITNTLIMYIKVYSYNETAIDIHIMKQQ